MKNIITNGSQKEAIFDLQELFFSITQKDSTILSGNDTFVRISGYSKDEIISQPHNIIRHEDMPRVIFKIFWDYLNAGKPIAAYVKNKTKQGLYYWVFAVVFPLNDRYISIRIKPNTETFCAVEQLYAKLLESQMTLSMKESEALVKESLKELGFRDYNHFIVEALMAEMVKRKSLFKTINIESDETCLESGLKHSVEKLYCTSESLLKQYSKWFEKIELYNKTKNLFRDKSIALRSLARDIVFLSLNASVASYKIDLFGETFGVLASDIRNNAKENNILINEIFDISDNLSVSLDEIIFTVSSLSLQTEMIIYFLKELFGKETEEFNASIDNLFELVNIYNNKLFNLTLEMENQIKQSIVHLEKLEQQIMYLDYIQVYGLIESSRHIDDKSGFGEIFSQLKILIKNTTSEIELIKDMGEEFFKENHTLENTSKGIEESLNKLNDEVSKIR
jgi:aerotaxis receptor